MASNDPVPPVTSSPVDDVPTLPSVPTPRPSAAGATPAVPNPSAAPPADEQLAPGTQRAQMSPDAASEPRAVGLRATVHDAAVHGSGIARAIEAAQRGTDSDSINQQLGGAAASAGSGQGTPIDAPGMADDDAGTPATDPLAAPARIGDGDERHRRQQHESELSAIDGEGGIQEPVQQDR